VSKAAIELGISQPAVSNALRRLNEHVGVSLFARDGRGTSPTAAGEALYARIRSPFQQTLDAFGAFECFSPASSVAQFSISVCPFYQPLFSGLLARELWVDAPNISLQFKSLAPATAFDDLYHSRLDLILAGGVSDRRGEVLDPLLDDCWELVVRRSHPVVKAVECCSIRELRKVRLIALTPPGGELPGVFKLLIDRGCELSLNTDSFGVVLDVLRRTDFASLMPSSVASVVCSDGRFIRSSLPKLPKAQLHMGWLAARESDPGLRWLREVIRRGVADRMALANA